MTWSPGRDRIDELLAAQDLERVTADDVLAERLIDDATRHLTTAAAGVAAGDLAGAYQLTYDAFRKSAAALLAAQGLRATSRGGHVAVQEAVNAQFTTSVGVFRSFGRIRRARNSYEYPDTDSAGPSTDDVQDAIRAATAARDAASTILGQNILTPW